MPLSFTSKSHALNLTSEEMRQKLEEAYSTLFVRAFSSAESLCDSACRRARIDPGIAVSLRGEDIQAFGDLSHKHMVERLRLSPQAKKFSDSALALLADQIQLLRAFHNPDDVIELVRAKVERVVDGFPRRAADLERGRNPGDVIDPFLLSATQYLMCGGSVESGLEAGVTHKCMMMLEDLIGNLHQDVIGKMRGNVRAPEPRGEGLDPFENPFPGADVVQVPAKAGGRLRVFQVKNKTGSAKGGDGIRLGEQLRRLEDTYDSEAYYVAILGTTLQGHRSMAGVLRACPTAIVAVGGTALRYLTNSSNGGELLLRVYQSAFRDIARAKGYTVREVATLIAQEFRSRMNANDEEILDGLLHDVIDGALDKQDSRHFIPPRGLRRS
jgi:hypothetical protein